MAEEKKRKVVGVEDPKIETKRLTIFLIAVFGIAWIAELGVIKPMYQSGDVDTVKEAVNMISSMMFAPAFASLIARVMTRKACYIQDSSLILQSISSAFCLDGLEQQR